MRVAVDTRGKRADSEQQHARRACERSGLSGQGISNDDAGNTGADRNVELCAFLNVAGNMRAWHRAARVDEHAAGNGISAFAAQPAIGHPHRNLCVRRRV